MFSPFAQVASETANHIVQKNPPRAILKVSSWLYFWAVKAGLWHRGAGSGQLPAVTGSKSREAAAALECWVSAVLVMGQDPRLLCCSSCCFATIVASPNSSPPNDGLAAGCQRMAQGRFVCCLSMAQSPEVWGVPAASSFALYPWRSISVSVNVRVLEKVCVAQILTCHCYLFIFFKSISELFCH